MKTDTSNECIDLCNTLLRGERSAVETYDIAIKKFEGHPQLSTLTRIRDEHRRSVGLLEENVRSMDGTPDEGSGTWGTFATLVEKTATLFGRESAIEALQKGEEKGRGDYSDALDSLIMMPECKQLVRDSLLPPILEHIKTLEALEEQLD